MRVISSIFLNCFYIPYYFEFKMNLGEKLFAVYVLDSLKIYFQFVWPLPLKNERLVIFKQFFFDVRRNVFLYQRNTWFSQCMKVLCRHNIDIIHILHLSDTSIFLVCIFRHLNWTRRLGFTCKSHIQSACGKRRTWKNSGLGNFSRSIDFWKLIPIKKYTIYRFLISFDKTYN